MSDTGYVYRTPIEETVSAWVSVFLIALPFIATARSWDRNGTGDFTVSDVWLIFGEAFTWPFRLAYSAFPQLFYFFEVYRPTEPTGTTACVGFIIWCAAFIGLYSIAHGLTARVADAIAAGKTKRGAP